MYTLRKKYMFTLLLFFSYTSHGGYLVEAHSNSQGSLIIQVFNEKENTWVQQHVDKIVPSEFTIPTIKEYLSLTDKETLAILDVYNLHHFNDTMYYTAFHPKLKRFFVLEHPTSAFCLSSKSTCPPIQLKFTGHIYRYELYNSDYSENISWIKLVQHTADSFISYGFSKRYKQNKVGQEITPFLFQAPTTDDDSSDDSALGFHDSLKKKLTSLHHLYHHNGTFYALGMQEEKENKNVFKLYAGPNCLQWTHIPFSPDVLPQHISLYTTFVMGENLILSGASEKTDFSEEYGGDTIYFVSKKLEQDDRVEGWSSHRVTLPGTRSLFYTVPPKYAADLTLVHNNHIVTIVKNLEEKHILVFFDKDYSATTFVNIPNDSALTVKEGQVRPYKLFSGESQHSFLLYGNHVFKVTSDSRLEFYSSFPYSGERGRDVLWVSES